MSSPAYVRWARGHFEAGMAEAGRNHHRVVVYIDVKVNAGGKMARAAMRQTLARRMPWQDIHLNTSGIAA